MLTTSNIDIMPLNLDTVKLEVRSRGSPWIKRLNCNGDVSIPSRRQVVVGSETRPQNTDFKLHGPPTGYPWDTRSVMLRDGCPLEVGCSFELSR